MFEIFVLLINEINPNGFCFVTCFLFIFPREALPHRGLLYTIFCVAYLRICGGYLPQEFAAGICRGNLPQVFAVGFLYIQANPFLYMWVNLVYMEANLFYMCAKLFWFVRFSLLTVLLLVIAVAVMGHRNFVMKHLYNELLHYSMQMQKSIVTF